MLQTLAFDMPLLLVHAFVQSSGFVQVKCLVLIDILIHAVTSLLVLGYDDIPSCFFSSSPSVCCAFCHHFFDER